MAIKRFPPVRQILGMVDDRQSLPKKADLGDAYYEESTGLLWVWDEEHARWHELGLWARHGGVMDLAGAATAAVATAATGGRAARGEKGTAGAVGKDGGAGKDGAPGRDGAPG
jgi:hypothetical protein